jgi:iron complex transport system substrate-binding protein
MKIRSFLILLTIVLFFSCGGRQTASPQAEGDTVRFKYATQLCVVHYDGYTVATLKNPWKEGMTLHRYLLVPDSSDVDITSLTSHHSPLTSSLVRTPLSRSVIFTTVHCAMLMSLEKEDCISGVADLKYIKIPWIQEQVKAGRIMDVGEGMSPMVEKIIDQRPDALFLSPFENSGGYGRLEEIGIPIIECAEYMESSPLARAEWLRFYGMLFGCEQKADSLFAVVDSSYCALKRLFTVDSLSSCVSAVASGKAERTDDYTKGSEGLASKSTVNCKPSTVNCKPSTVNCKPSTVNQKTVLVDKVTGSVWYVPGGKSTIGQMIRDAGGFYPWAEDDHSGSVSLPFEAVLEKAGEADVWLFRYSSDHDITSDELLSEHHGYRQFKAFRSGQVYGCDVERSLFYEESPFRPDWLLADFIHILHPDLSDLPPLRYYKKVKEL